MNDDEFEQLRDALAPGRSPEGRLGALWVLASSDLDGDDRVVSLLSTLLSDREPSVAANAAAMVLADRKLAALLKRECARAWATQSADYRRLLVECAPQKVLAGLGEAVGASSDRELRLAYVRRLAETAPANGSAPSGDAPPAADEDALLFLSRDDDSEVRASALQALVRAGATGARPATLRLLEDPEPAVRIAALRALNDVCPPDEARDTVRDALLDTDLDVRAAAAEARQRAQEALNLEAVAPIVKRQKEAIEAGEYQRAMALGAQVFMRVADHPECQYQIARAAGGLRDGRRALRLLANAFEAGFNDCVAAATDPLFADARGCEEWPEVIALCPALYEPGTDGPEPPVEPLPADGAGA